MFMTRVIVQDTQGLLPSSWMKTMRKHKTRIHTKDFDGFVSDVAREIWNKMVDQPSFHILKPEHYADLYEAVCHVLGAHRAGN